MSTPTSLPRKTALITGGSGGIGLELARLFAADRHDLVLIARDRVKLKEVGIELQNHYGIEVRVMPKDLSDRKSVEEIFPELREAGVTIDVLVNNAGIGAAGPFAEIPVDTHLNVVQVNITALTYLTRTFLPQIRARKGKILNVASTAGFQAGPFMAVYYASKAYVISFSEALAEELSGSGVVVSCLCPGPTPTGFQARAGMKDQRMLKGRFVSDVAMVAKEGYEGLTRGKRIVIPGWPMWALVQSARFAPRRLVTKISRYLAEPQRK